MYAFTLDKSVGRYGLVVDLPSSKRTGSGYELVGSQLNDWLGNFPILLRSATQAHLVSKQASESFASYEPAMDRPKKDKKTYLRVASFAYTISYHLPCLLRLLIIGQLIASKVQLATTPH